MTVLFSLLASSLGRMLAVAAIAFIAGALVCWHFTHRAPKVFSDTFTVASVKSGATIEVAAGLAGRKSRAVAIEGITAPGPNDPCGPRSQGNLKALAGETIRVETSREQGAGRIEARIGTQPIVGSVYSESGQDLGLAQLTAGLASCQTGATKEQIAAQKAAQKAKRGLWAKGDGGAHWWHFSIAAESFPEPTVTSDTEPVGTRNMPVLDYGLILEILVVAIVAVWIFWSLFGATITAAWSGGKTVTAAVDTSEQLAAYAALTAIRYTPCVSADPTAVADCEYLRTVCTAWKAAPATTAATTAATK